MALHYLMVCCLQKRELRVCQTKNKTLSWSKNSGKYAILQSVFVSISVTELLHIQNITWSNRRSTHNELNGDRLTDPSSITKGTSNQLKSTG